MAESGSGKIANDAVSELLIEDLKHFGDSLWRNEEAGEKRISFFVTLVTAVAAGLVTLNTREDVLLLPVSARCITMIAFGGLLAFGFMTYLRMLQRIRVKKEFHATLKYIRGQLGGSTPGYSVPIKFDRPKKGVVAAAIRGGARGSLAALVSAINAFLLAGLCWLVAPPPGAFVAVTVGAVFFAVCCTCAGWMENRPERSHAS